MNLADCLGRERQDNSWNVRVDDALTEGNFSVPPGVDVSLVHIGLCYFLFSFSMLQLLIK